MKKGAYPIILEKTDDGYYVKIPDFGIGTQGETIVDAMEMARDAIGLMGIDLEDDGKQIPEPGSVKVEVEKNNILTLVDIDFLEYRRRVDNKAVKKNCTIPYWMSVEADKKGVNYSRLLQEAIASVLGINKEKC
ncbi:MAG TPA: type II toxin-antitoxin system HicB family antitoxin [Candidatus Blautia avistercoris]|uniref:type II toxin-antitoxin system HicB family antitoxin n=1 Tax=Blautia sp. An249 TaxID=1965603 RepID=UPI000B387F7A|nr:type II toxin-antitoxin system HicB family antitoxin [Blautia sp. An249]OUO76934.1 HicB family protein [Blautia sp. An249]HIY18853.1 type II toxin-antitoxin system HicB family antitoxin [Candidatus Blautia avistercoris]